MEQGSNVKEVQMKVRDEKMWKQIKGSSAIRK